VGQSTCESRQQEDEEDGLKGHFGRKKINWRDGEIKSVMLSNLGRDMTGEAKERVQRTSVAQTAGQGFTVDDRAEKCCVAFSNINFAATMHVYLLGWEYTDGCVGETVH
jgi:hypothetical protein